MRAGLTLFILMLAVALVLGAGDQVVFTIVGRVQFSVPSDWLVVTSKSTPEKTVFAFQIPNIADRGTPDSTNLVIVSSFLKDGKDREAFNKKASSSQDTAKEKRLVEGWRCWSFSAMQKSTEYVDWDCYRVVADCGLFVRMAWPHLPKNPVDYDERMQAILSNFLTTVGPSDRLSHQLPQTGMRARATFETKA